MAYVPPSGGSIVVEISTAQGYVPPSASSIVVDLAVEDGGGGSGTTSFISGNGVLTLAPEHTIKAVIGHTMPVADLLLTAYSPTHAVTSTSVISSVGALAVEGQAPSYSASSAVGAGALTLTPQQPVYFMGYTQTIVEQGALVLSPGGVSAQLCANQISTAGMLLSGQEPTASATTAVTDTAALALTGNPLAGQKMVVKAEIESTYFYPNVTLDVSGELTLTPYAPSQLFHIRNGIEGYCGLMGRVVVEVEGRYTARVAAGVDAGYAVRGVCAKAYEGQYDVSATDRVISAIESPYRFPIAVVYEARYSLKESIIARAEVVSSYSSRTNTPVRNSVEGLYSYNALLRLAVEATYSLTSPLATAVDAGYSLEPVAKARASVEGIYSMPASQVIAITAPPYIEYKGRVLPIEEAEVSIAEGDYLWTCTAVLTHVSDYVQLRLDQEFALVIGAERYEFVVDGKELDRNAPANKGMRLTGVSPSAKFASPRCVSADYAWNVVMSAASIAEELLPGVDWRVVDWAIPAYRFSVQGATPVEAVRALAEAVGAVLESDIDGALYVRSKYPVSVPNYETASVAHTFVEETDILTVNESYLSAERFNRLVITDVEQSISDSLAWIEDYDGATTGVIRAYLYPWRTGVSLLHTGVGTVTIADPVTTVEEHEEILEVFQGQSSAGYPIHHVESVEYEAQDTGGIVFDPDSRAFTVPGPAFNSVIRLVYRSRSLDFRVSLPDGRPTQFLLESDPL